MADVSKINGYNIKDITARNQLEKLTNRSITISAGAGTTNVGWWQVVKIAKSSISLSQNYSAVFLVNGIYGNQGQSCAEPSGIIEVDVRNNSGILTQQTVSLISGNLNAANIGISINDSDYLYLYHKVGSEYRSVTYTLISENINGATVFEPTFVSSTMPAGTAYAVNRNKAVYAETARNYETSGGTIKEKFDTHDTQINSHQVEITNIKNGTTIVGKANNANTAAAATQANNYNTSTGTIKSKFDELEEKIDSGGTPSNMMTTDTVQDVTGQKKFGDYKLVIKDHADFLSANIDINEDGKGESFAYFNGKDKNGQLLGAIGFYQDNGGNTGAYLQANHGSVWGGNLGIKTKIGTSDVYAYAPNPPQSSDANQIATTKWVNNKLRLRASLLYLPTVTTGNKVIKQLTKYQLLLFSIKVGSQHFPFFVPLAEFVARNSTDNVLAMEANCDAYNRYTTLYYVNSTTIRVVSAVEIDSLEVFGF